MTIVTATALPEDSALQSWRTAGQFADAYEAVLLEPDRSPTQIFLQATRATPGWVSMLMSWRNAVARRVGLKDLSDRRAGLARGAVEPAVGERLGIFSVLRRTERELVLGIDDRHLDVRVSVWKSPEGAPARYVVSTVVKVHNALGRAYMVPVARIHPRVVRAMMRRARV